MGGGWGSIYILYLEMESNSLCRYGDPAKREKVLWLYVVSASGI
jgi:hypothetical protein